ncbi:MAG: radical SAM protein [Bacteroidales bacterium]|nr:radical SAM protein [Bacteroidales bacterium]MCF8352641.1 radical SAM protein [Bacteroidales bacterium]MCF8376521.1 radical SAM protein [Bacteroidales bacterium]MCF8400627.1 radical SAM protein [Bacteroidales bacterium]
MFYHPISYDEPLFRPPSEAYSFILQLTLGCSWNRCAFCEMYTTKQFKVRPVEEIREDIRKMEPYADQIRKVFLADGNALVLSTPKLSAILDELNNSFPKINRISAYAIAKDLKNKTVDELKNLREKGLQLLYVGIESGDDEVLEAVNKGETFESQKEALLKAKAAGMRLSVMILNGLGGKNMSEQHAVSSARLCNEIQPEFLSTLVLSYPHGQGHFKKRFRGEFEPLDMYGLIKEMKIFIQNLELGHTVFRSDHASNYLVLRGNLNRDKEELLQRIDQALDQPGQAGLRQEWMRGL